MLRSLAPVLQVPPQHVILKVREQQKGKQQYEKLSADLSGYQCS